MALRAQMLQARRGPPPLVVPRARGSPTHGASGHATLRDGAGKPHRCVSRRSFGMTKPRSSVLALRLSGLRRHRRNSVNRPNMNRIDSNAVDASLRRKCGHETATSGAQASPGATRHRMLRPVLEVADKNKVRLRARRTKHDPVIDQGLFAEGQRRAIARHTQASTW
jgi:hypothetical protein